jgi:ElaB/YqjD/DUF883 family membrane-anchored ribosome-binding protein
MNTLNTLNPLEFLSSAFSQEKISEQQLKAKEFAQAVNTETQKQLSKFPQRLQETVDVAQQNINSFQETIKKSSANFQNPQTILNLWSDHIQSSYQRNVALFQKHHNENINSFGELKNYFEQSGSQLKSDTEKNLHQFQEKSTEVMENIQKNIDKIQTEIKNNLETSHDQAINSFKDVVKQTNSLNIAVQDQVTKGINSISNVIESTSVAAQEVVKATSSTKKGKN